MKKHIGIFVAVMMFCSLFVSTAKVRYEEKDGKVYCIIDYKDDNLGAVNCIGSMTGNWKEPGEPMYKNAEGRWEYKFEMLRAKEFYKFYDPAKSGEAAYFEDPEAPEAVANPFGSKNGVVRKPKAGGAAEAVVEETFPKLNFGMWSRTTFNMFFKSQLSRRVGYEKDGKVKTSDTVKVAGGDTVKVDGDNVNMAVYNENLGHRWEGENGTTKGNATRVWLDNTRFRSSNTFKVHGMVFKHMQLDTEVNFNATVITGYSDYWAASTAEDRTKAINTIQRNAASQYMGLVFGPFATNGAWGRWVGEKNSSWDNDPDNNCIWIDQIVISFPFDDVEAKVGILGNNSAKSKDPMTLLSGKRTGWKEDIATNLEFYIHPKAVKNLNVLVGAAHTWRDMSLEKGKGEVWYSGDRVDNSDRKYYTYLNADYKMDMVDFGAMWYFNSWSISALDMFANGEMTIAPWVRIKPIKGLTVEAEVATNVSTIYMDTIQDNDNFYDYATYRTAKKQWDIFANSAVLASVSYVMPSFFNVGLSLKAAGTTFKGILGDEDGQFSGWFDTDRRVNGITNYSAGVRPYNNDDAGASILTAVDFSINPLKNKVLTIGTKEEFVVGKLDSPLMKKDDGADVDKRQIDLVSSPFIGTEIGDLALNAGVVFSYTNYQDGTLTIDGSKKVNSTNLLTFNAAVLNFTYSNISEVLKSVEIAYQSEVAYYNAFYAGTSTEVWDLMKNNIQAKSLYNQVVATLNFDKDISLGLGFIVRNYFGDQDNNNYMNLLNKTMLDKMTNKQAFGLSGMAYATASSLKEAYYQQRIDYWNIGGAAQFKYKVPIEAIQFPTFFVNLGLGWDPFDDDGQTTSNWIKDVDSAGNKSWKKNNSGWSEETSVFTVGMQWDF